MLLPGHAAETPQPCLTGKEVLAVQAKDKKPRQHKPFIRRKGRSAKNDQAAADLDVQRSAAASPATSSRQLPGAPTPLI